MKIKKPLPFWQGLYIEYVGQKNQPPQEPELQEPELHPPPPTGLVEVMENPER